jgi:hypothetical protein
MIEVRADAICGISTLCLGLKPFFCSFHQILQVSQAIHKHLNAYSRMPLIQIMSRFLLDGYKGSKLIGFKCSFKSWACRCL